MRTVGAEVAHEPLSGRRHECATACRNDVGPIRAPRDRRRNRQRGERVVVARRERRETRTPGIRRHIGVARRLKQCPRHHTLGNSERVLTNRRPHELEVRLVEHHLNGVAVMLRAMQQPTAERQVRATKTKRCRHVLHHDRRRSTFEPAINQLAAVGAVHASASAFTSTPRCSIGGADIGGQKTVTSSPVAASASATCAV